MKKIFEIPIYAFDENTLEKRVENLRKNLLGSILGLMIKV